MPITVQFDQPVRGRDQRALLYGGAINVTSPSSTSIAFAMHTRELVGDAFGGHHPESSQFDLPVADFATILDGLSERFLRHPGSRRFLRQMLIERGCDPETTYVTAPRLCTSTSDDYLATGIASAWHPHRDTWRSAPLAQLNHRMPVFAEDQDGTLTVHPEYFNQAIANDSANYDHHRCAPADRATSRHLPGPTETVNPFSGSVFVTPVGGVLQFSGQHLHSVVPNDSGRTRFSIEFDTIDVGDIRLGLGARNVDGRSSGSTIREFGCVADFSPVPGDVVALLDAHPARRDDRVNVPLIQPALTKA